MGSPFLNLFTEDDFATLQVNVACYDRYKMVYYQKLIKNEKKNRFQLFYHYYKNGSLLTD